KVSRRQTPTQASRIDVHHQALALPPERGLLIPGEPLEHLLHPPIDAIPEPSDAPSRAFDGRSGTLFGPGGEASTVVHQRRATEDLAGLDTADEDPMVAGLDRPRHHAGRVRDRCVA